MLSALAFTGGGFFCETTAFMRRERPFIHPPIALISADEAIFMIHRLNGLNGFGRR